MKVLVIAPTVIDLPLVAEEAAAVANSLPETVLLQGDEASARGIINAIAQHGEFEGFWFAAHGSEAGVQLTGTILDAISLASLLAAAGAKWIVLNTCASRLLVNAVQLRATVDIIATETPNIKDADAWEFGRLLAIQYGRTHDIKEAVALVARGSDHHRYYEHNQRKTASTPMDRDINPDRLTDQEILRLLYDRIIGNALRGTPGIIGTIESMSASIAALATAQATERHQREALAETVHHNQESADSKFTTQSMWIGLALSIVAIEGVAILFIVISRI